MNKLTDTYELSNGVQIPVVGFGTWQTPSGDVAKASVKSALAAGYRHLDTAEMYHNESSVGEGIAESGVAREDIFLTSKLANTEHTYDQAQAAFAQTLKDLGVDYLDLFLIHWPNPAAYREDNWESHLQETWRAFEDLYNEGKIKAIGVSNFRPRHFKVLEETQTIMPMVNQIRLAPGDTNKETIDYAHDHNIQLEAYSPLGTGAIFAEPTMVEIAERIGRSVAQVTLRWSLQNGFLPLPKSVHADRIEENTHLFDFELSDEDMAKINALEGVVGYAQDPDTATF
ncbi:aldo/keto reductase [Dellaglioa algida]|uniref:Aldo keto reductase family oxidoreductase n=2 Tax=Dellaglioa algida TaxID=105612 RepID=A0A0R1HHT8_9LACO|nr:aldo/keto reductase [Dellaglioa algida]KRK45871.1 aldo keto reductase family oxidoreductase [Dellaglioa algida DSM 15638]MDK1716211.1 aldo/keto reductase [Dellaglioa algida]MDK1717899.1 aldo/keto reductase [Dellaglioa algida]MDK1719492.1 aldo/keto reductase [Dellaglioa algida]MDK1721006.1 aldo/keto reductase [Dellaglioa algida]